METATMSWIDTEIMSRKLKDEELRAGFLAVAPQLLSDIQTIINRRAVPVAAGARRHTVGELG